jgi:hypothetical protein
MDRFAKTDPRQHVSCSNRLSDLVGIAANLIGMVEGIICQRGNGPSDDRDARWSMGRLPRGNRILRGIA